MKLPRYIATTPPPRETGLARAQDIGALTRTGGAEFEALTQLGGAIQKTAGLGYQAYMNRQALDDQATMGEISKRATDADTEAVSAISGFDPSVGDALPDDPKNYYDGTKVNRFDSPQKEMFINTTYKDYEAKILNLAKGIKNPKTRQAWINSQLPEAYKQITSAANLKQQEYQEQLILSNAKAAAANGDMEIADEWINIAEKYGLIGPKKAAVERENNIKEHVTGLYRAGLHDEARKVLESSSLGNVEKEQMDDTIDSDEKALLGINRLQDEAAIEAELQAVDDVIILPQDEFLAGAPAMLKKINDSEILPVKGVNGAGKEGQRKKINDRIKAISEGKTDPINQFDPYEYSKLERRITQNSMMVKGTDITSRVGLGQNRGLTVAQAKDLTALKKFYDGADILGTDLHRIYSGAIVGLRTSKTFSKNKADNALYAARASAALNAWAVKNPNATDADYQAFFDRLMDRSFMDNWGRGWFIRKPEEQRVAVRENIATMEAELGIRNVKVKHPDGREGTIPAGQLKEAIKEGYKEVK